MLTAALKSFIEIAKYIFFTAWSIFLVWILFCSFDVNPPLKDLNILVKDASPGEKIGVTITFIRTRQCSLKRSIDVTDIAGQNVFTSFIEKLVNGNIGPGRQDYDFPIDPKAQAGPANFDMYLEWECPYNIVHQTVKPITLHYNAPFTIKEKQ